MGKGSKSVYGPQNRKCHDCGKPTSDYRCPKCLAKWRVKYGVSPFAVENSNFNSYASCSSRVSTKNFD